MPKGSKITYTMTTLIVKARSWLLELQVSKLAPEIRNLLNNQNIKKLYEHNIINIYDLNEITEQTYNILTSPSIVKLLMTGNLDKQRAMKLTSLQLSILGDGDISQLIIDGLLSINVALELELEKRNNLTDPNIMQTLYNKNPEYDYGWAIQLTAKEVSEYSYQSTTNLALK